MLHVLGNRKWGMDADMLRDWLNEGLKKTSRKGPLTKSGLAKELGISASGVSDLQKPGGRNILGHQVPIIARYLEIGMPQGFDPSSAAEVVSAQEKSFQRVTVVGKVQAGHFIAIDEFDQSEPETFYEPADPDFPRARRTAFDVVGDSMNKLEPAPILPGSRVIGVNYDDIGIPLRDNMVVIVQQERDGGQLREWSIKQVELQDDAVVFHPRSSNSRHKPIVVPRDAKASDGREVRVLALVREIKNRVPVF